jgi:hypothetical protein
MVQPPTRRPDVSLIVLGNEPRPANGLNLDGRVVDGEFEMT